MICCEPNDLGCLHGPHEDNDHAPCICNHSWEQHEKGEASCWNGALCPCKNYIPMRNYFRPRADIPNRPSVYHQGGNQFGMESERIYRADEADKIFEVMERKIAKHEKIKVSLLAELEWSGSLDKNRHYSELATCVMCHGNKETGHDIDCTFYKPLHRLWINRAIIDNNE